MTSKLALASRSPRRQEMLKRLGIPFDVVPGDVQENQHPNESPADYVQRIAKSKAQEAARHLDPSTWVLAADTAVVVDSEILGKPRDPKDARSMLCLLSGRKHLVLTAVHLMSLAAEKKFEFLCETSVWFRNLTAATINDYVSTQEPFDKAGGYAIQGIGAMLVRSISGSYTNVVGLPLAETVTLLEETGVWRPGENPRICPETPKGGTS